MVDRDGDVNNCLHRDQFHLEDVEVAEVIEMYVPEEIWKLERDKNTRELLSLILKAMEM